MGTVTRLARKVGLAAPSADEPDEIATARKTIAECNATIRKCLSESKRLNVELVTAREHEARIRDQLGLVEPARERAREAKDADAADRKSRMQKGEPGSDPALSKALDEAEQAVREAERNAEAAAEVLPGLAERVRELQWEIENTASRRDGAVWRRRMAELTLELPAVRAANALLSDFARRIVALKDIGASHNSYGTPGGYVPADIIAACKVKREFENAEMRPYVQPEVQYLKRLRTDPDATLA